MNKLWNSPAVEYYTAIKRAIYNATTCVDLSNYAESKKQDQKGVYTV